MGVGCGILSATPMNLCINYNLLAIDIVKCKITLDALCVVKMSFALTSNRPVNSIRGHVIVESR